MQKHNSIIFSVFSKSVAFTLAEVLIVLGIIGIIAEMTIPTLMNNVADAQVKAGMKVAYSTLAQAALAAANDSGGSMGGGALKDLIKSQLNYTKDCDSGLSGGCLPSGTLSLDGTASSFDSLNALVLKNGMTMTFYTDSSDCTACIGTCTECGWVLVDVNGFKKPNRIGKDSATFYVFSDGKVTPWGNSDSSCGGSGYTAGMSCTWKFLYD